MLGACPGVACASVAFEWCGSAPVVCAVAAEVALATTMAARLVMRIRAVTVITSSLPQGSAGPARSHGLRLQPGNALPVVQVPAVRQCSTAARAFVVALTRAAHSRGASQAFLSERTRIETGPKHRSMVRRISCFFCSHTFFEINPFELDGSLDSDADAEPN